MGRVGGTAGIDMAGTFFGELGIGDSLAMLARGLRLFNTDEVGARASDYAVGATRALAEGHGPFDE